MKSVICSSSVVPGPLPTPPTRRAPRRARACDSSASRRAPSRPNSVHYCLSQAADHCPACLPSVSSVPITSRMSSTIWKSTPNSPAKAWNDEIVARCVRTVEQQDALDAGGDHMRVLLRTSPRYPIPCVRISLGSACACSSAVSTRTGRLIAASIECVPAARRCATHLAQFLIVPRLRRRVGRALRSSTTSSM